MTQAKYQVNHNLYRGLHLEFASGTQNKELLTEQPSLGLEIPAVGAYYYAWADRMLSQANESNYPDTLWSTIALIPRIFRWPDSTEAMGHAIRTWCHNMGICGMPVAQSSVWQNLQNLRRSCGHMLAAWFRHKVLLGQVNKGAPHLATLQSPEEDLLTRSSE